MQWEKIVVYAEYYNTPPNNRHQRTSGPRACRPRAKPTNIKHQTDPDGNNVYYLFDWGDGQQSNTGWLASGQTGALSHIWASPGIYGVKVAACDTFGFWSGLGQAILYVQVVSPSGRGQVIGLWSIFPCCKRFWKTTGNRIKAALEDQWPVKASEPSSS